MSAGRRRTDPVPASDAFYFFVHRLINALARLLWRYTVTGRENIQINALILGLTKKQVAERFDKIVDFAGIGDFLDAPVRTYSSGMFMRLAFSVAIHVDPEVLLIDEVLAVGDEAFQRKCLTTIEERVRSKRQTRITCSAGIARPGMPLASVAQAAPA